MGGGKDSGGSSVNVAPSPYESTLANIAQDLYSSTSPLRSAFIRDYSQILGLGGGTTGTGTTGGGGTGGTVNIQGGGYYLNPSGVWSPYTADAGGYYADSSGNLYPSSQVRNLGAELANNPLLNLIGYQGGPQYVVEQYDAAGNPIPGITVNPSNLTPGPATLSGSTSTGGGSSGTAGGRYDPTQLPTYAPLFGLQKQSLESQYQNAKKSVMGSVGRGGNLAGALTGLESNRAATMGALPAELSSGILTDMLNKAYGAAFNTPTTTMSGLSTAAGTYSNRAAAAMAQSAADQQSTYGLLGNVGGAIGTGIGKAIGGK